MGKMSGRNASLERVVIDRGAGCGHYFRDE